MHADPHPSSFRDPDGSIFTRDGEIYRVIYNSYKDNFELLHSSGLLKDLQEQDWLVRHVELEPGYVTLQEPAAVYKIIKPELIPFISYPQEWCFSQLKAAALLTLDIQLAALSKGMSLKDATAYNVQFKGATPVFIDTLSFEAYEDNKPWQAYGQFCRHFLGPLLLWVYNKHEIAHLGLKYPDGIPLKIVSQSLPFKTRLNFSAWSHIHYHARLEKNFESKAPQGVKTLGLSKSRLTAIVSHLKNYVQGLELKKSASPWLNYYETFSYSKEGFARKKEIVTMFTKQVNPATVLDIGCNEGEFSILCAPLAKQVISIDADAFVVEQLYRAAAAIKTTNILPLVVDISNPTPGTGFNNAERSAFPERCRPDLSLALALLHHVTIGNNVPFRLFARQLAQLAPALIIEFVPKEDPQAQKLLVTRRDIFTDYHLAGFKTAFERYFSISQQQAIGSSGRILFLMQRHA